jgi:hypothetical protein
MAPLNLSWVTHDLALGGSFPEREAEQLARTLGISAVVDLRSEGCDDEAVLRRHGLTLLHLPTDDHCAVSQRCSPTASPSRAIASTPGRRC